MRRSLSIARALAAVLTACAAVSVWGAMPSTAAAQLRAGVPLDALRSALHQQSAGELSIGEIAIPGDDALPVRLPIVRAQQPVALLDVRVLGSSDEARAWIAERAPAISTAEVTARTGDLYADTARGRAGLVMVARANVAIVVRTIDADLDAIALAEIVCAVVDAAPAGSPAPRSIAAPSADSLALDGSLPVQLPSWAVAARVIASGAGYARRTPRGWMVTRTGEGPITVRVVAIDDHLRVTR